MDREKWLKVKRVFEEALDREPVARRAYLDEACAGDDALRAEVESMLTAHRADADFLDPPSEGAAASLLESPPEDDRCGQQVGNYRLIELIGVGGMGHVYSATRIGDPVGRLVAVKLLRSGLESDALVRHFVRERKTLGELDHPNIARLLDGGNLGEGQPYLVMEYVEGRPVDVYCDEQRLTVARRLELFRETCAAVQYAHANLIVHRDLKPNNILVTEDGQPKLLDFGIAKLLGEDGPLDPQTTTISAMRIMTPHYASPEQIRGQAITTASDVYSLGVVLYELLIGHSPYTADQEERYAIQMSVCEEQPERPSAAVWRTSTRRQPNGTTLVLTPDRVGEVRCARPRQLGRWLRGDLDVIVLTALQKDPRRRYRSVEELSEDIRRYLVGLPIRARTDTFTYRVSKFMGRNKGIVAASFIALLFLIGGLIGTSIGMQRAEDALAKAEVETDRAQLLAFQLKKINAMLDEMVSGPDTSVRADALALSPQFEAAMRAVSESLPDRSRLRSVMHESFGAAYQRAGAYGKARRHLRMALRYRPELESPLDTDRDNTGMGMPR